MKNNRQQQEIVVSGLNINASDVSSGAEEDLSEAEDEALMEEQHMMSLIEPAAVRKVGGGGFVSLSAFQVCLLFILVSCKTMELAR